MWFTRELGIPIDVPLLQTSRSLEHRHHRLTWILLRRGPDLVKNHTQSRISPLETKTSEPQRKLEDTIVADLRALEDEFG